MSLNFPANPNNGDTYTSGSIVYVYQDPPGKWTASTYSSGIFVQRDGDTMTGALGMPVGSAASPSVYFDTDTGLYSPGADQFSVATAGTSRLVIDSSGNVGIGTTSPLSELHLHGPTSGVGPIFNLTNDTGDCRIFFGQNTSTGSANAAGQIRYNVANNTLGFYTNLNERMRIDSSGNVGIGTSSPNENLHISEANGGGDVALRIQNDSDTDAGTTASLRFTASSTDTFNTASIIVDRNTRSIAFDTIGSERMRIDSSGNVGIGLTSVNSTRRVEIKQPSSYSAALRILADGNGNDGLIQWFSGLSHYEIGVNQGTDALLFKRDGSEKMRIDSSGNVGIGTQSPSNLLDVASTVGDGIRIGSTVAGTITRETEGLRITGASTTKAISFVTAGSEAMRVDTSGRLLVGKTTASGSLTGCELRSDGFGLFTRASENPLQVRRLLDDGDLVQFYQDSEFIGSVGCDGSDLTIGVNGSERMRISQNGSFDCYTSSNDGFSVRTSAGAGTGAHVYQAYRNASSTTSGTIVYRVYSNGTYATISDATQKKNISTARDGYLKDLNALRVVKYHWNEQDDSEQKELGLIAQEVETVFPGLIAEFDSDSGETIKGVKSSVLTFMLIKALQEATGRIETLEGKVAALEAQ